MTYDKFEMMNDRFAGLAPALNLTNLDKLETNDYDARCSNIQPPGEMMLIKVSLHIATAAMFLFLFVSPATSQPSPKYDLLIKNGTIIDGSGRPRYKADVAINKDRIVQIGKLRNAKATREIDATGMIVAPGFIDMLGQSETYLLIDPRAMSKVMMGVTTEVTGEGESIAPTNERLIKEQEDFNRRYKLTIDWRTLDDYFKTPRAAGHGVNLATFVGATQVREYVVGFDNRAPLPTSSNDETTVADAMKDGALGVSTHCIRPRSFAKTDEIVELAKVRGNTAASTSRITQ